MYEDALKAIALAAHSLEAPRHDVIVEQQEVIRPDGIVREGAKWPRDETPPRDRFSSFAL